MRNCGYTRKVGETWDSAKMRGDVGQGKWYCKRPRPQKQVYLERKLESFNDFDA